MQKQKEKGTSGEWNTPGTPLDFGVPPVPNRINDVFGAIRSVLHGQDVDQLTRLSHILAWARDHLPTFHQQALVDYANAMMGTSHRMSELVAPCDPLAAFCEALPNRRRNIGSMNAQQSEAYVAMRALHKNMITSPVAKANGDIAGQVHGVFGWAGCGKTFVLGEFVRTLDAEQLKQTRFVALTHKAVGVLAHRVHQVRPAATCMTLHRFLGLRLEECLETGEERWVGHFTEQNTELLIIDECSMIDDQMWSLIAEANERHGPFKVILLGDSEQLLPVGDSTPSPCMFAPHTTLTEVVRHGGPILEAATAARNHGKVTQSLVSDESRVSVFFDLERWLYEFRNSYHAADDAIILAWRNKTVDALNERLREELVPLAERYPYAPGERVMMRKPYFDGMGNLIFENYERVQVVTAEPYLIQGHECWRLLLRNVQGREHVAFALEHGEKRAWYRHVSQLKTYAKGLPRNTARRREAFRRYFATKRIMADIQAIYAMTVHKSQGSTFEHVYVHQNDILACEATSGPDLRRRLLYVAYSRAARSLNVMVGG